MFSKFSLTVLFITSQVAIHAQSPKTNNIWYFGDRAGLDFSQGAPVVLTNSAMTCWDVSATACNNSGHLVMYCNGDTIWNKSHQPMPNGTGLLGNITAGQTALILNQYETEKYYVFTVGEFAVANGCRYSVVDLSLDGGLGDVVPGQKNISLFGPSTEKLTAVWNRAGNYFWVITHQWNNNTFACYKLDYNGLNTVPVLSIVGTSHTGGTYGGDHNAMGQMVVSPDGSRIGITLELAGIIELFDFDINTGILSNPVKIMNYPRALGLAFSSNGEKLYCTRLSYDMIYQFDLSNYTQAAIAASATVVGNVTSSGQFFGYPAAYLHLAPDGKIYVPHIVDSVIGVIQYPNVDGTACNYVDHAINLLGKSSNPGMCQGPVYTNQFDAVPETATSSFILFPNPAKDRFTVKLPEYKGQEQWKLKIYSMDGKLIKSLEVTGQQTIVRTSGMAAGNYVVALENKGIKVLSQGISIR